jgi:2'-5' RNA ligase
MDEKIRAFIAIDLSRRMREELARIQGSLKDAGADVKWVRPASIHLTLKFLGNITTETLERTKGIVNDVSSRHKPFDITLFRLGCFPRIDRPRVIWAGIDKGCSEVEAIARELEDKLSSIGFEREKRAFSSHLTLGRVRSHKGKERLVSRIEAMDIGPSPPSRVDRIILFRSRLTPDGAIYTPLYEGVLA